jgi:flagellar biosynthesis protein FliR
MQLDISFLPGYAAAFLLMFARIGTMVMLLPALGEMSIPTRIRLVTALALTFVLFPLHRAAFDVDLRTFAPVLTLLGQEMIVGGLLGMTARLAISALQVAGSVLAQQMGLGFVMALDPTQNQQGALLGTFLSVLGVTLLFATDMHHLLIVALSESYNLFRPGELPFSGDMAALAVRIVSSAFRIGIQLAAPFLVLGLMFNFCLGILSRLMPQMQVFFVGLPLSILAGLVVLVFVIGSMMGTFLEFFEGIARELAAPR